MTSTIGWITRSEAGGGERSTTRRDAQRADIQGLRAIAVLFVVIYHAELPLPAGFTGVDMFFVISGFVITGQIERMRRSGRFSFATFYARRIRRLLPAMVVMLLTVLVLSFLFESPIGTQGVTAGTALAAVLLYANHHILATSGGYFAASAVMNPLLHVWSLSVEEQFYLVFPLVLVLAWALGRGRTWVRAAVLGGLTAASFGVSLWLTYADRTISSFASSDIAFYSSYTRAWEFGAGALLALWAGARSARAALPAAGAETAGTSGAGTGTASTGSADSPTEGPTAAATTARRLRAVGPTGLAVLGLVLLFVMNRTVTSSMLWPGWGALLPVAATCLLIMAGTIGGGPVTRLLSVRPLVVIGDLSYSIYLWHWPLIVIMHLVWPHSWMPALAAALSLIPAVLSYRYVEQPFRHGRIRLPKVYLSGVVTVALVVLAALGLQILGPKAIPNASAYAVQRYELTFGRANDCLVRNRPYTAADFENCMTTVPNAKGWVMLAGDSHADALSSGLIAADSALGYSTLALTGASCPFMRDAQPSREVSNCGDLAAALLDRATSSDDPPALVVIGQWALPRYSNDGEWPEQLRPALEELTDAGIPVIYSMDVPNWATQAMDRQAACSGGFVNFVCDRSEQSILDYQGASREQERVVADSVPGVSIFDPWSRFCNGTTCSPLIDGKLAYWDFDHLNRIGSLALTDDLKTAVSAAVDAK